jgi:hypothetical protein
MGVSVIFNDKRLTTFIGTDAEADLFVAIQFSDTPEVMVAHGHLDAKMEADVRQLSAPKRSARNVISFNWLARKTL